MRLLRPHFGCEATFIIIDWHAVATLATWLMTLVIQRAEHRDTQAIHGKLDELLRVNRDVETDLAEGDRIHVGRCQHLLT